MESWQIVVLTIVGLIALKFLIAMALSGGSFQRVMLAWRIAWMTMRSADTAEKVDEMLNPPPPEPEKLDPAPIRLLTLLQREGRLVDFLMEEIGEATDEQIAAGVREIHHDCQKALREHLDLAPVFSQREGEAVEVAEGFDPSAVQLTGNVAGEPPFRGELRHPGWRVKEIKIKEGAEGVDESVIQPAEVEIM